MATTGDQAYGGTIALYADPVAVIFYLSSPVGTCLQVMGRQNSIGNGCAMQEKRIRTARLESAHRDHHKSSAWVFLRLTAMPMC